MKKKVEWTVSSEGHSCRDAGEDIEKMTGSKEIMEMSENKGIENMCTALEELKMQGREEGRIYGAIFVYRDFKLPEKGISKMLQEKSGLTPRETEEYLKKV